MFGMQTKIISHSIYVSSQAPIPVSHCFDRLVRGCSRFRDADQTPGREKKKCTRENNLRKRGYAVCRTMANITYWFVFNAYGTLQSALVKMYCIM